MLFINDFLRSVKTTNHPSGELKYTADNSSSERIDDSIFWGVMKKKREIIFTFLRYEKYYYKLILSKKF